MGVVWMKLSFSFGRSPGLESRVGIFRTEESGGNVEMDWRRAGSRCSMAIGWKWKSSSRATSELNGALLDMLSDGTDRGEERRFSPFQCILKCLRCQRSRSSVNGYHATLTKR